MKFQTYFALAISFASSVTGVAAPSSGCQGYSCTADFKRNSLALDRLLNGKTLTCTLRNPPSYYSGSFSLSVHQRPIGRRKVEHLASIDSSLFDVGYADDFISQLSVGSNENVVVSWGDDGRIVALFGAIKANWEPRAESHCEGTLTADVLFYPEFSPDEQVSTDLVKADCCLH